MQQELYGYLVHRFVLSSLRTLPTKKKEKEKEKDNKVQ